HEAPDLVQRLVIINSLNGISLIPSYYPLPLVPENCPSEEDVRRELMEFYFDRRLVTAARVTKTHEYSVRNYEFARARMRATGRTPEEWNQHLTYRGRHISEYAGQLVMPILLTWSRENRGASPANALAFFNRLLDVDMHVFSRAGHHVMTEHP